MPSSGSPRAAASASSRASARDHSGHVKAPRSWSESAIANAWASHGAANVGPASSRGNAGSAARSTSDGVKVVLEHVEVHAVARGPLGTPELARLKANAVAVLRLGVASHRVRIGEREDAVVDADRSAPATDVARKPGVTDRVHPTRDHRVARLELGRHVGGDA